MHKYEPFWVSRETWQKAGIEKWKYIKEMTGAKSEIQMHAMNKALFYSPILHHHIYIIHVVMS